MSDSSISWRRPITGAFYALVLVFLMIYLRQFDYSQLEGLEFRLLPALLATIVGLAFRYWGVFIWQRILLELGAQGLPSFRSLSGVYSKAWLGRYLPGKVAWIGGKVFFASDHGVPKKQLAVSSVLEALVQVIATFAVAVGFLAFDPRFDAIDVRIRFTILIGGAVLAILAIPAVFNRVIQLLLRVVRKQVDPDGMRVSNRVVVRAFLLYVVGYFISGASYFFLTSSMHPLSYGDFFYVVAVFNIAGAVGIASIFAPSGIGVREGIQLVLLPAIMPFEIAVAITAVSRLFSILVDLVFFVLGQLGLRTESTS